MNISEQIGQNFKNARKIKNLTQQNISEYSPIGQTRLSNIEMGKVQADYETILTLCQIYEISPNDVFDIKKNEKKDFNDDEHDILKKLAYLISKVD